MSRKWPYDDLRWWCYALHSSAFPLTSGEEDEVALRPLLSGDLETITGAFKQELCNIATGYLQPLEAAHRLQALRALVKWRIADPQLREQRQAKALDGFVERNRIAGGLPLPPYPYRDRMRLLLARWLPEPSGAAVTGNFGPGAVAEHYTHKRRFERLHEWCQQSTHWPEVPVGHADFGRSTCRLCAVPKDYAKDRLITVEPAYGSFSQQYVRQLVLESIHRGPLRGTCMDLGWVDGQAIQRRLAMKASREKKWATVDLSDASDNITFEAVRDLFPAWLVPYLEVTRSQGFVSRDGASHCMHIYAGMGNATTFVVETLFFAAYVAAIGWAHGRSPWCSVFGDDIICATETADLAKRLSLPGLPINEAKTFLGAQALREACGVFAYNGVDITPVRTDGYPDTFEGRIAVSSLHARLVRTGRLDHRLLAESIAAERVLPNWPKRYNGFPSISDWSIPWDAEPQTRYNRHLQRREAKLPMREPRTLRLPLGSVGLCAWFTGTLPTDGTHAVFPKGTYRWRLRWCEESGE